MALSQPLHESKTVAAADHLNRAQGDGGALGQLNRPGSQTVLVALDQSEWLRAYDANPEFIHRECLQSTLGGADLHVGLELMGTGKAVGTVDIAGRSQAHGVGAPVPGKRIALGRHHHVTRRYRL